MGLKKTRRWKGGLAAITALGLGVPAWAGTHLIFDSQSGKRQTPSSADPEDEHPGPKPLVAPQDNEDATELHPSVSSNHTPAEAAPGDVVYTDAEEPTGPQPRVQVIVDGSGSMAEELEGEKTKMYFAKKLLSKYLIQQWKEKAEVSLRVYGSRRTKDCTDIYRAVPFRARSLDEIARKVAVIEPTGKTPIAESLKAAYDDLKSYNGPKRIVLFTDGQETCGGDPCELVKKFDVDKGVDLKIYVVAIGMDPNSDEAKGISCLGDVSFAQDSSDMESDLGNISKQISKHNNLFVDNPDPSAGVTVFRILDNGDRVPFKGFTASFGTNVPPGKYAAEVRVDPPFEFREFYVPPHKTVTLKVRGKGLVEVKFVKALASV
ncbi:MAG TPA: VWA domain-containing protein, partial [Bdellovibrionota bacterium]|nr:VWA domain-containing protein [Bdellovibrionota bacterium]